MRRALYLALFLVAACGSTAKTATTPAVPNGPSCALTGTYKHVTADAGEATIKFTPSGPNAWKAVETGLGNFTGEAKLDGSTLRVDWKTENGFAGNYVWTLDASCAAGEGTLTFTEGGQGTHHSVFSYVGP